MTDLPLWILSIAAPLGAFDVLYFHMYRFRLHDRPASWAETATHVLRGLLIGGFAFLLANYQPQGAWFWLGAALIVGDTLNNIADVVLEPKAREALGGLPPAEYLIHVVGATVSGLIGATYLLAFWPMAALPTALAPAALPAWLAVNGNLIAFGAVAIALTEATLMARSMLRARALTASPA